MAKAKFDSKRIKQYLFEKGEFVALWAAMGLMGFFFLYTVYVLLFGSPAQDTGIRADVEALKMKIASASPEEGKDAVVKPEKMPEWKLGLAGNKFVLGGWYDGSEGVDNKRYNPQILAAETAIKEVEKKVDGVTRKETVRPIQIVLIKGAAEVYDIKAGKSARVIADNTGKYKDPVFNVRPVTLVEVTMTFPYKDQMELFKKALRINTVPDLFAKGMEPKIEGINVFRFEKLADGSWKEEKLYWAESDGKTAAAAPILDLLREARIDESNADNLDQFILPNAVSPRVEMAFGEYPRLALTGILPLKDLEGIKVFVPKQKKPGKIDVPLGKDKLKGKGKEGKPIDSEDITDMPLRLLPEVLEDRFRGKLNPLDPYGNLAPVKPKDEKVVGGGQPKLEIRPQMMAKHAKPVTKAPENDKMLIRFIDTDLKPGATYYYGVQVRMSNPNYNKPTEVAYPALADPKELLSPVATTGQLTVPAEYAFYIFDQPAPKTRITKGKGVDQSMSLNLTGPPRLDQVPVQIQKWVGKVPIPGEKEWRVGDWAIAERVFIHRGESIGGTFEVESPVYSDKKQAFDIGPDNRPSQGNVPPGLLIDFTEKGATPTVVDIAGGRTAMKGGADEGALEVLLLGPDGKLFVRNSRDDHDNNSPAGEERQRRYDEWRARLEMIRMLAAPPDNKKKAN